ncbi:MAG: hypothetical protein QXU18_09220 [Thermoplasmatales archaeon]
MFDEETINAFSGGYNVSESGVSTILGLPSVSNLKKVMSFPVSLRITALVKRNKSVKWKGINSIELPFENSKLTNDWYDPLRMMTNIAHQRGWKNAPYIFADEQLGFQMSMGYYSALIDLIVESFSLVNDVSLSTSELLQISGEIQDRIRGQHNAYETIARKEGKEGNLFLYDMASKSYRNESINFEPYSMFLVSENSLDSNPNFATFLKSFRKFNDSNMMNRDPNSLTFPYLGIMNHLTIEHSIFDRAIESLQNNAIELFISTISEYSQSLGFNLRVLSEFQKTMAGLLEKYGIKTYVFNISEYSGSLIVFADSLNLAKIKDNAIRDYYNLTNRTIRIDELTIANGSSHEPIRI